MKTYRVEFILDVPNDASDFDVEQAVSNAIDAGGITMATADPKDDVVTLEPKDITAEEE